MMVVARAIVVFAVALGATAAGVQPSNAPQWTPQVSGVTATLRGVSAASPTVAWASGSGSTVLRTDDAGATWQRVVITPDRLDFRDIDAINTQVAYALSIGNGAASRIYKTVDAGRTWTLQYTGDDERIFLDAMTFWDEANGIVFGDSFDAQFFILITSDGGRTWRRVPPADLPPAQAGEGAFAASGTNIAVWGTTHAWIGTGAAAKARVLRTTDRGRTWSIAETPLAGGDTSGIYSVAFRDATHGVVVGGNYAREREAVNNLAVTSDGGATWTLVTQQALGGFRSVVRHVPGTASTFIAVGPQGSDVSADDGRSWTALPDAAQAPAAPGFHTFSFAPGSKVGWGAGGRGAIARLVLD